MRDDLSEIFYDAGRDDVEYLFGDHITAIGEDGDVTFAHHAPRRFDLVIGADGLHSGVRQLVFGPDAGHTEFLGAYLSVMSVPKSLAREADMTGYVDVDRTAMIYTADHLDDARAVFVPAGEQLPIRPPRCREPATPAARPVRRDERRGGPLAGRARTHARVLLRRHHPAAVDQLVARQGHLVGDAGYCPGPAVGGSTSLAVIGAYVLAGELQRAGGDPAVAYPAYEQVMLDPVIGARALAKSVAKGILPSSPLGVQSLLGVGRLISVLPEPLTAALAGLNSKGIRLYDSIAVPQYESADV